MTWSGKERRRGAQMRALGDRRWEAGDKIASAAAHDAAHRFEDDRDCHAQRVAALREGLISACRSTSSGRIVDGRIAIEAMPRLWLVAHIEKVATEALDLSDDWEFRRLLEVVVLLDAPEVQARLVHLGMQPGTSPDVAEAAVDFMPTVPTLRSGAGRRLPDTRVREIAHAALATLRVLLDEGLIPVSMTDEVAALLAEAGA